MIDLSRVRNYYIACGYTDLRYGIDGLAACVRRCKMTARPSKSDTLTAEIQHSFRRSDS